MSVPMASKDMALVRELWAQNLEDDLQQVRADGVARFGALYKECLEGHEAAKREGRHTEKFLLAAAKILTEKHKLQGLVCDVNLVQNSLVVNGQANPTEVLNAFAPLDPADYQSFIEAQGGFTALPAIPTEDPPPPADITNDDNSWPGGSNEPIEVKATEPPKPAGPRPIHHPFGRF